MNLDTAILYDIEYLIGSNRLLKDQVELNINDILDSIKPKLVGQIALQKAYANWEDPMLLKLKKELLSLGIDPVQKITHKKNTPYYIAQLQLVIDAVEISYEKKIIKNLIIVSGDNIFNILNKRMAMSGIKLTSCAYKKHKEKISIDISHEYIWLDNLQKFEHQKNQKFVDPIVFNFTKKFEIIESANIKYGIKLCKDVLKYLASTESVLDRLMSQGINISVISQLFESRIKNFNYFIFGYTRLVDFIMFLIVDSPYKLVFKSPSEYRFTLINNEIKGFESYTTNVEPSEIHTKDFYRVLLKKTKPQHKSFDKINIYRVSKFLLEQKKLIKGQNLKQIISRLFLDLNIEEKIAKEVILTMKASNCFKIDNILSPVPDQIIAFELDTPEAFHQCIINAMRTKLEHRLSSVDANILEDVLN